MNGGSSNVLEVGQLWLVDNYSYYPLVMNHSVILQFIDDCPIKTFIGQGHVWLPEGNFKDCDI